VAAEGGCGEASDGRASPEPLLVPRVTLAPALRVGLPASCGRAELASCGTLASVASNVCNVLQQLSAPTAESPSLRYFRRDVESP